MIDTTVFQNKTAVYYTLGCKLNFSETSTIGKILREVGVRTARKGEKADICVVNTCSVTEMADKKCRQAIHRLVKQHPGAFVIVTGCYAQLKPGDVAKIDGVDVVLGAEQKGELLQYLGDLQKHEKGDMIMPKMKTRRAAAKRFTKTGTGEFKRNKAFKSHILEKKTQKRKRNFRKAALVSKSDYKRVARLLPNG